MKKRAKIYCAFIVVWVFLIAAACQGGSFTEVKKILPVGDPCEDDYFGGAVSISGDTAVVGAAWHDTIGLTNSGSAYIFYRNRNGADNWGQVAGITAADPCITDYFGDSVSISGDTVIVGVPFDDVNSLASAGSAYIFERNQGGADNWGQVTKITADDPCAVDRFGSPVSISGDTVIVGVPYDDVNSLNTAGSAYIFERNQGGADNWGQVTKITADDPCAGDHFGNSVSISGDTAVVGAYLHDTIGLTSSGSAYIFYRNRNGADSWGQVAGIAAADPCEYDNFSWSVSISGDTVIVGVPFDDVNSLANAGSAYIFERNQGGADNWGQVTRITSADPCEDDRFGESVSISGDTVIVGAYADDDNGDVSGSAYIFERNQGGADNWGQVTKITASDAAAFDYFGGAVSISGDTALVGAHKDDDNGNDSGSAYIFRDFQPCGLSADLTGDCTVNMKDVAVMCNQWLLSQ